MNTLQKCISLALCACIGLSACTAGQPPAAGSTENTDTQNGESTAETTETVETMDTKEMQDTERGGETAEVIVDPFAPEEDTRWGTAVNVDCDAIVYMARKHGMDLTDLEQKCADWFNGLYKDCGVSDILYNVDGVVPSESRKEYCDFYSEALKNGEKLPEAFAEMCKVYHTVYNEMQFDPYTLWMELCRENGINPWLSFRMNDVHAANDGYGIEPFVQKAIDEGWIIGLEAGWGSWYQWALDYSVPEVRVYFLTYIDEILGKYDVYGIELDFQREIHCFKKDTPDNCPYMSLFMEEVNGIVAKYEKQYGHEIRIAVHLSRDIDQNRYFGLDVPAWAEKGWIDVVIPASAFGSTDSDMPIEAWKDALKEYANVEVWAGLECHVTDTEAYQQPTTLAAFTSMYLQRGADKIYLFNLFNGGKYTFQTCASLEDAFKYIKRSYVVTKQNQKPNVSEIQNYTPLPLKADDGEATEPIVISHGRLNADRECYIYVGLLNREKDFAEKLTVYYNGTACEYTGTAVKAFAGTSGKFKCILAYRVPYEVWVNAVQGEITFCAEQSVRIGYVELMNGIPGIG